MRYISNGERDKDMIVLADTQQSAAQLRKKIPIEDAAVTLAVLYERIADSYDQLSRPEQWDICFDDEEELTRVETIKSGIEKHNRLQKLSGWLEGILDVDAPAISKADESDLDMGDLLEELSFSLTENGRSNARQAEKATLGEMAKIIKA